MNQAYRVSNESTLYNQAHQQIFVKEMSISEDTFAKLLARIDGGTVGFVGRLSSHYKLKSPNGLVDISCRKKQGRVLGSLSIPVLEVRINFERYKPSQIDEFIKSFNRVFLYQSG